MYLSENHKKELELGEHLEVQCWASGNPQPHVWWAKDIDEDRLVSVPVGSGKPKNVLTIQSLSEEDYGKYVCFAANAHGNDSLDLTLGTMC